MIVQRHKANIRVIESISLSPGTNFVPDTIAERLLKNVEFQKELKAGWMTLPVQKKKEDGKSKTTDDDGSQIPSPSEPASTFGDEILQVNSKQAIELVKSNYKLYDLRHALKLEERKSVRKAIEAQIEYMQSPEDEGTGTAQGDGGHEDLGHHS